MVIKKLRLIAIGVILSILIVGCSYNNKKDSVVVVVNGQNITLDYFEKTLKLQKDAIESTYGEDVWKQEVEKGIKFKDRFTEQVLDEIVKIHSIYGEAKKANLLASEKEIEEGFSQVKSTIESSEDFKKSLEQIGINDEYIKNQQAQDLAIQNYKEMLEESIVITDEEAKKYYDENKEEFYDKEQRPFEEVRDYIKMELKKDKLVDSLEQIAKDAKVEKNEEIIKNIKF